MISELGYNLGGVKYILYQFQTLNFLVSFVHLGWSFLSCYIHSGNDV